MVFCYDERPKNVECDDQRKIAVRKALIPA
jgi:hypothetical protein